jgi:predicted short-subunit dehydrogenase-like oxidoreductase (DUF2520 family)
MRELERDPSPAPRLAVIGSGRLGTALAASLRSAGYEVQGPLGRGADAAGADVALLCVPDRAIASAAGSVAAGVVVGHCSGAAPLSELGTREGFLLHPLMTVTSAAASAAGKGALFSGAGAAIAGSSPRAFELARQLAWALEMTPVEIADEDRAAYHAAASLASNFLVTLEGVAERLAAEVGVDRELLAPLVRATVENWVALGARRALTGPIARGDEATVVRQREAICDRAPELLWLFDALADATRTLAAAPEPAPAEAAAPEPAPAEAAAPEPAPAETEAPEPAPVEAAA